MKYKYRIFDLSNNHSWQHFVHYAGGLNIKDTDWINIALKPFNGVYHYTAHWIEFNNEQDAIVFKLRFG